MGFNFKSSQFIEKTYTKEGGVGEQFWNMKYRSAGEKAMFYISKEGPQKLWSALNLDTMGLVQVNSYDDSGKVTGVALAVVDDARATLKKTRMMKMKGSEEKKPTDKTNSFSSDVLESALVEAGLIDKANEDNQFLKLESLGKVVDATSSPLKRAKTDEAGDDIYEIVRDEEATAKFQESKAVKQDA